MPDPERKNASCTQEAKHENKSFIIKGRGSSVVEQPIRNRQVVGSTPTLGSSIFLKLFTLRGSVH